jgi:phosphatidylglycerol---prolipoprotein diacylglyceryl transferase
MTPYGFFSAIGGITAILWLRRHRAGLGVTDNEFWAAMWTLMLGGIVGAKGLFVILGWHHYAQGELRFWADFGIGFVFFGGLLGAVTAGVVFATVQRLDFLRGADYFAVALPLGHAMGRVGCYFQGCCGGRPPHPVQLYEAAGLLMIAGLARWVLSRVQSSRLRVGTAFAAYLTMYGLLRVLLDPLRADGRPERWLGLSAQQGFALAVFALGMVGVYRGCRQKATPVTSHP